MFFFFARFFQKKNSVVLFSSVRVLVGVVAAHTTTGIHILDGVCIDEIALIDLPSSLLGGGSRGGLIKYTGVIKYTARKPILSVEICEIKYTVFVYIFLTKKIFQQVLHKKSKIIFFDFGGPDSVRAVMGSLCAEKRVF